jgi:hypothetical protein
VLVPLLAAAGGLVAFGAKLMLIRTHGSDVPFYDEWDAVGRQLLVPMAQGALPASHFFLPQNEHRIVLVRLMAYLVTLANGQWDPLIEMTVGAAVHSAFCAATILLARRFLAGVPFLLACIAILLMFASPFDWENTLQALQAQHYLLLGCAVGTIWLCVPSRPLGTRWWFGFGFAVLGLGTMASGFVAAAVVLAVSLAGAASRKSITHAERAGALLMGCICIVGLFAAGSAAPSGAVSAHTALGTLARLAAALSWPFLGAPAMCVVMQLPIALLAARRLRERRVHPLEGVLLAIALWCWIQTAAIAWSRGQADSPRYMDLYALDCIANLIAMGILCSERPAKRMNLFAAVLFLGSFACGFHSLGTFTHEVYIDRIPAIKAAEKLHVMEYLSSGDPAALAKAPSNELPYPVADRLAGILDAPGIRSMLPVGIRAPVALKPEPASIGFSRADARDLPAGYGGEGWIASRGPAHFVSEPLPLGLLPYLHIQAAGSPDLATSAFRLESDVAVGLDFSARSLGREWRSVDLALPPNATTRLVVDIPAGDHWLAFVNPIEIGAGSVDTRWLLRRSGVLACLSGILLAILLLAVAARDLTESGAQETRKSYVSNSI